MSVACELCGQKKFWWRDEGKLTVPGFPTARDHSSPCTSVLCYRLHFSSSCEEQSTKSYITRGQSNLTKSAHSPVRGHPRGSKVVPLNSWGRVSY